VPSRTAHLNR